MKLLQRLSLVPAILSLVAPIAQASELNVPEVSKRAATSEQVTSVFQFSDIYPTDWAYQALSSLVEQYGCVAGYPNRAFRGNRAMTRFEAAALLNACLNRVGEVTDGVRRLTKEFEAELAVLGGRADGLEARIGELEATRFSTTTKLRGKTDFFIGGVGYEDRGKCNRQGGACTDDSISFSYRYTLNMDTSFTGKDMLYVRLRAGNMNNIWTQNDSYLSDAKSGDNSLKVDKIWYHFSPIRSSIGEFKFTVGGLVENYYMLETPTRYKPILKAFKLGGYGTVMGASTGQGIGLQWRQNSSRGKSGFNAATTYVADGGDGAKSAFKEGMLGENTDMIWLNQAGYSSRRWGVFALYGLKKADIDRKTGRVDVKAAMGYSTPAAKKLGRSLSVIGLRSYWSPKRNGLIPQISTGIDFGIAGTSRSSQAERTFGWMAGLNWRNAFLEGNNLAIGLGSYSSYATKIKGASSNKESNFAIEAYYDFQITDNIKITPAVFWISNAEGNAQVDGANKVGVLAKASFRF
ncbi:porin [cyanobiont of Ornithocercus magnificus]|nr:porin [cyanobiont of Ornithocercus magnificus]